MRVPKGQQLVSLGLINLDESPRMRFNIRDEVVKDYAAIYKEYHGKPHNPLPPVELFKVQGRPGFFVADGQHRIRGCRASGTLTIRAHVSYGSWADCLRAACSYNVSHGLRRSDEDKRAIVEEIFAHGGAKYSNNHIATLARVSEDLVSKTRKILESIGSVEKVEFRRNAEGVERKVRENKPKVEKDRRGTEIPKEAHAYWERRNECNELLEYLEKIRVHLYRASITNDPLYVEIDMNAAAADLRRLQHNLKLAIPYVVCTQCQGRFESQPGGQCSMCKGRGLISQFRYEHCSPEEIKLIRDRANKAETISGNSH